MIKDIIQRIDMLYINIGIICSAILTIMLSIWIYTLKCKHQKKTYSIAFEELMKRYEMDVGRNKEDLEADKKVFDIILMRAYSSLSTYFRYQVINKVFGVTSCVLAAVVFIEPTTLSEQIGNRLVAIISIICVMTIVYINPMDRARDYLDDWHMWIEYAAGVITGFYKSVDDGEKVLAELSAKIEQENKILKADKM